MAEFTGTASVGLQYLGQGNPGEKFGYLTIGTHPMSFILNKRLFF
jgi:hypothetical protein